MIIPASVTPVKHRQIVQKLKSKNKDDLYTSFQISNQSS
jgi:hypothetical protein